MDVILYCDASYYPNENNAIVAAIIKTTSFKAVEKVYCQNSLEAELLAIICGMSLIKNLQQEGQLPSHCNISIRSDNKVLITSINRKKYINGIPKCIKNEYKSLYSQVKEHNEINFKWVKRKNNKEADRATHQVDCLINSDDELSSK